MKPSRTGRDYRDLRQALELGWCEKVSQVLFFLQSNITHSSGGSPPRSGFQQRKIDTVTIESSLEMKTEFCTCIQYTGIMVYLCLSTPATTPGPVLYAAHAKKLLLAPIISSILHTRILHSIGPMLCSSMLVCKMAPNQSRPSHS